MSNEFLTLSTVVTALYLSRYLIVRLSWTGLQKSLKRRELKESFLQYQGCDNALV